jgi:hypothetical protein
MNDSGPRSCVVVGLVATRPWVFLASFLADALFDAPPNPPYQFEE